MIFKCKNCGGNSIYSPEQGSMFCPHCDSKESHERTMEECDKQLCPNCGGEIQVGEHTSALKCGYCDHYIILNDRVEGEYSPRKLIPFKYGKDKVKELMREKFKKATFAPTDFLSEVMLDTMEGDYVPYWMVDYDVNCDYQAEGIKVRHWTSGDYEYTETSYYEVVRNIDVDYQNIPVDASVKMPDEVMDLLEPYDYSAMVEFSPEYMSGFNGEKYNMPYSDVDFRAKDKMYNSADSIVRQSVSGYSRMTVMHKIFNINREAHAYDLLPVWKYTYNYGDKSYPFYVNGQTGKIVGKVPVSKKKVFVYGGTLFVLLNVIMTSIVAIASFMI